MKTMVVPERLFISTDRVKELMDNMGKIMVTAYEIWKREQLAKGDKYNLADLSPEQNCEIFIKEISGQ